MDQQTTIPAKYDPSATYVTATDWGVSCTVPTALFGGPVPDPRVTLNVHRYEPDTPNSLGGVGLIVHHPVHNGLRFESREDASRYALANDLLKPYRRTPRPTDSRELAL